MVLNLFWNDQGLRNAVSNMIRKLQLKGERNSSNKVLYTVEYEDVSNTGLYTIGVSHAIRLQCTRQVNLC